MIGTARYSSINAL